MARPWISAPQLQGLCRANGINDDDEDDQDDHNGSQLIPMDSNRSQWIQMDSNGS